MNIKYEAERNRLLGEIACANAENFEELAMQVFRFQCQHNETYQRFIRFSKVKYQTIERIDQIPFLPISVFKQHEVKTGSIWTPEKVFTSSGTTGQLNSRHLVRDNNWYLENTVRGFEQFYGPINDWAVLALLPNYLEREGSSLVEMAQHFIGLSDYKELCGFYLYNTDELLQTLARCEEKNIRVLLLGVSFALLDLAEQHNVKLPPNSVVMETGGMKGRRKELVREELHQILCAGLGVTSIHSEYGMTELLSQGYSKGEGLFRPSNTLKVLVREATDPFTLIGHGRTGCLNLIDLANIDSCAFLATDDLGKTYSDGSFEVLGRFDASDVRGCNLMVQ